MVVFVGVTVFFGLAGGTALGGSHTPVDGLIGVFLLLTLFVGLVFNILRKRPDARPGAGPRIAVLVGALALGMLVGWALTY